MKWQYILWAVLLLAGCKYQEGMEEVTVENQYKISIPHYLSETDRLAPEERDVIQYQNRYRAIYMIVVDEPKPPHELSVYTKGIVSEFKEPLKKVEIERLERKELNGLPVQFHEITGTISGERIYYLLVTAEGAEHYYQIAIWTKADKKEMYQTDFTKIVDSFQEI